jgi:hypothetical protein
VDPAGEQDTVKHKEKAFSKKLPPAAEYHNLFCQESSSY